MARKIKDNRLGSREARRKLEPRNTPYWSHITGNLFVGYRKGLRVGSWLVRFLDDDTKTRKQEKLGTADDIADADGIILLSFDQAQEAARIWLAKRAAGDTHVGPYTVKDALADYISDYQRRGGKSHDQTAAAINALILPALGGIDITKLSRKKIEDWHDALSKAAPRLRTKLGGDQKYRELDSSPEGIRRRRSSANRILTILKAALNLAHERRKIANDDAWRSVKAYREVDAARVRYLNDMESRRLVNACSSELRPLVQAALLTGCRLSELTRCSAADYNPDSGTLQVIVSKGGKPRHAVLTDEGKTFFRNATAGKVGSALIFTKPSETLGRIAQITGLDCGRLCALSVGDFCQTGEKFSLNTGKDVIEVNAAAGKAIRRMVEGRSASEPLVPVPHYVRWGKSVHHRPFKEAVKKAGIGDITYHEMRHTYASRLVMAGTPLMVVAPQLGHRDTRMVEKHYGHLAPSYVADTIRAKFTSLGIVEDTNVVSM